MKKQYSFFYREPRRTDLDLDMDEMSKPNISIECLQFECRNTTKEIMMKVLH